MEDVIKFDVVSVTRLEATNALKLSRLESLRAQKFAGQIVVFFEQYKANIFFFSCKKQLYMSPRLSVAPSAVGRWSVGGPTRVLVCSKRDNTIINVKCNECNEFNEFNESR